MMEVRAGALRRRVFREFLDKNGFVYEEDKALAFSVFYIRATPIDQAYIHRFMEKIRESV